MGYASALAWVMFIAIVVLTVILFKTSARWVYYGSEE
jgi:multiple sugar transport system permease protein